MGRSIRIGTAAGIPLFLHWSFLLIPGYILLDGLLTGRAAFAVASDLMLVLIVFSCVVLHELGHALAARRFGVATRDIILMPIGGVARLERMPKRPLEELIVAIAGPAVNVLIASVLLLVTVPAVGLSALLDPDSVVLAFVGKAIVVNIVMIVFNLIPAFPMDGGRVLRAALSAGMGHLKATRIAAAVGKLMAVLLGLTGLFVLHNPFLLFIAGFVFLGAGQEAAMAEAEAVLGGLRVENAMMTRFDAVPAQASVEWALRFAMSAGQQELVIVTSGVFTGMVRVEDLLKAVSDGESATSVGSLSHCDLTPLRPDEPLSKAIEQLHGSRYSSIPVVNATGYLQGLVTWSSLRAARRFGSVTTGRQFHSWPNELRHHLSRLQV